MKNVSIKNVSVLILVYLLGVISSIFVIYIQEIDVLDIYQSLRNESVDQGVEIPQIQIDEVEEITQPQEEEIIDTCPILVDVSGAVKSPGVYCLDKESSVVDAIKKSGGFLQDVGYKYVSMNLNMAQILRDNSKIYIPYTTDLYCSIIDFNLPKEVEEVVSPVVEDEQDTGNSNCVNINTATLEQLDSLTGVGPSTAQKIIDGRPYSKPEDLLNVSGIGQSTLDKILNEICI